MQSIHGDQLHGSKISYTLLIQYLKQKASLHWRIFHSDAVDGDREQAVTKFTKDDEDTPREQWYMNHMDWIA